MLAFITGKVHSYGFDYVILENSGIGFRINYMHPETLALNKEVTIYTYQHVREDEISLFGFASSQEYDLFMSLIQVKGIGPKTAQNILAHRSVNELISIIENNDVNSLKALPGIGAKAASQIILDLKGKLVHSDEAARKEANPELEDAIGALKTLGYKQNEITPIMKELQKHTELKSSEEFVRLGLQLLLKRKGG